jgi:hypothetical protein
VVSKCDRSFHRIDFFERYSPESFSSNLDLLKETSNNQSLTVSGESAIQEDPSSVEEICSIIIPHVDQSKLRHLEALVYNFNQMKRISDRFQDLLSIQFFCQNKSLKSEKIIAFVKTMVPECSVLNEYL